MRNYLVATDVGGTCTDTIVFAAGEPAHLGKTLSSPPDFSVGVMDSIDSYDPTEKRRRAIIDAARQAELEANRIRQIRGE